MSGTELIKTWLTFFGIFMGIVAALAVIIGMGVFLANHSLVLGLIWLCIAVAIVMASAYTYIQH